MKTYIFSKELREAAKVIAQNRYNTNRELGRADGKFTDSYEGITADWQGLIAELRLKELHPEWVYGQDLVVNSTDTFKPDFIWGNLRLEVKCNYFPRLYSHCFVNVHRMKKTLGLFDKLICCGINAKPSIAWILYVFGWIPPQEVMRFQIERSFDSPCYKVPREAIGDF